jgi:hypothetical protein
MPAPGSTPIIIYNSATASQVPLAANLSQGELAINVTDKKLYTKDSGGNVILIASNGGDVTGPATATDNAIARFDATTGRLIQNSVVTIADTTGNMAGVGTLTATTVNAALNGTLGATTPSTVAATTISASGVSTFSAGSAGAPAITTAGDTNTGMFFPAADTIAFSEGGTESMRIDSSGNLGLGVTPSVWKTGTKAIEIGSTGSALYSYASNLLTLVNNATFNGTNWIYSQTGQPPSLYTLSAGTHYWDRAVAGTAGNAVSLITSMILDSSGNLGIGTTSPGAKLDIQTGANTRLRISESGTDVYQDSLNAAASAWTPAVYRATQFTWNNGSSNRMIIDSSGSLGIRTTPSAWAAGFSVIETIGGSLTSGGNFEQYLGQNYYYTGASGSRYVSSNPASSYGQASGVHTWYTAVGGVAGALVNGTGQLTTIMTLNASGNLGIGETSPPAPGGTDARTLTLKGTKYPQFIYKATAAPANSTTWRTASRDTLEFQIQTVNDAITTEQTAYEITRTSGSNSINYHRWYTDTSERMRLDASGNLTVTGGVTAAGLTTTGGRIIDTNGINGGGMRLKTVGGQVAGSTGTLLLDLEVPVPFSTQGGFAGTLCISSTIFNSYQNSTQAIYSVSGRGTTATFTLLNSTAGSSSATTFTLSMSANGVIRFTNTSGSDTYTTMVFSGVVGNGN